MPANRTPSQILKIIPNVALANLRAGARFSSVKNAIVFVIGLAIALALHRPVAAQDPFLAEWTVPGSPYSIAVQSKDVVWATLPNENAILRLEVSPLGAATSTQFDLPKPNSQPYDIVFAGNAVWFTEIAGNRIGRLNPTSGAIDEFDVDTPASHPAGLAVLPGAPTRVWFAERNANALGRLTITNTLSFDFDEYPIPWPGGEPESVVTDGSNIWFSAPGASRLGLFRPHLWPASSAYYGIGAGAGSRPWGVTLDVLARPWLTDRQTHRVGIYLPGTLSDFRWFTPRTPNSDPYDLIAVGDQIAFVERLGNRVALLNQESGSIRERSMPGAGPTSLAVDSNRCIWVAENESQKIGRWCPPYFEMLYLPVVKR